MGTILFAIIVFLLAVVLIAFVLFIGLLSAVGEWIVKLLTGLWEALFGGPSPRTGAGQSQGHGRPGQGGGTTRIDGGSSPRFDSELYSVLESGFEFCAVWLCSKFTKLDGVVSQNEIKRMEKVFSFLGLNSERRGAAIQVFNQSKKSDSTYQDALYFIQEAIDSIENPIQKEYHVKLITGVCYHLFDIAHADGSPNSQAIRGLRQACEAFGYDYDSFLDYYRTQEQASDHSTSSRIENAYKILDCKHSDSDELIKKRYKEKAKSFHPDSLSGKNVNEEILKIAAEKFREVQEAYELVTQHRKNR